MDTEERRIDIEHKQQLNNYIESIAQQRDLRQPGQTAEAVMVVIEGAIIRAK